MTEPNVVRLKTALDGLTARFLAAIVLGFADFAVFSLPGNSIYIDATKSLAVVIFVCVWVYAAIVWFKAFRVRQELRKARNAA
jgi:hypothetical protein